MFCERLKGFTDIAAACRMTLIGTHLFEHGYPFF